MRAIENNPWSGSGVSEVIGFLIIFSIIIMGIGLVTLYGYPMLLQQQSSANERVMEKNMIVLQNDIKSLSYSMVPFSQTSMSIGGGTLYVYNRTTGVSPSAFNIDCGGFPLIPPNSTGRIQYESIDAQTDIALENGAVVVRMLNINGSTMLAEPRWFYDSQTNTAAIYLIYFNSTDSMSRAGIGTVSLARGNSNFAAYPINSGTCTVSYTPDSTNDYSAAWNSYFHNSMGLTESPPGSGKYILLTGPGQIVIYQDDIIVKSV